MADLICKKGIRIGELMHSVCDSIGLCYSLDTDPKVFYDARRIIPCKCIGNYRIFIFIFFTHLSLFAHLLGFNREDKWRRSLSRLFTGIIFFIFSYRLTVRVCNVYLL